MRYECDRSPHPAAVPCPDCRQIDYSGQLWSIDTVREFFGYQTPESTRKLLSDAGIYAIGGYPPDEIKQLKRDREAQGIKRRYRNGRGKASS